MRVFMIRMNNLHAGDSVAGGLHRTNIIVDYLVILRQ